MEVNEFIPDRRYCKELVYPVGVLGGCRVDHITRPVEVGIRVIEAAAEVILLVLGVEDVLAFVLKIVLLARDRVEAEVDLGQLELLHGVFEANLVDVEVGFERGWRFW